MIKNIIFDLGNVMFNNPTELAEKFFTTQEDIKKVNLYIFKSEFWQKLDLGKITNEEVFEEISSKKIMNLENYDEFKNFILNWYTQIEPNIETLQLGKTLKQKEYNIFVLSNMSLKTFEYLKTNYDFFEVSSGNIVSCYEHLKKPDERFFKILLERFNIIPEESILIDDDDTGKTFETAHNLKINGRPVKPNDTKDVIKLLSEYNIIV